MASPAIYRYGGGRHTILMTETDPVNFAKVLLAKKITKLAC